MHAILGASERCIALHASDLCVALVALDAAVHIQGPTTTRRVPLTDFYVLPGDRPEVENVLDRGELITAVDIPLPPVGTRSAYIKVRDRASYEFALVSVAAALVVVDGVFVDARLALGGVGTIPWRARSAETVLERGELITEIEIPLLPRVARSGYLKVRDRASYEFALVSVAAALAVVDGVIVDARLALGGVATIPWRARAAETVLRGASPGPGVVAAAASAAIDDPFTVEGTAFKATLAERAIIRILEDLSA